MKQSFNISITLLGLCALASSKPIPQVEASFGTPTGTLQLGDGKVIPNSLQTGDGKVVPNSLQAGDGKTIPATAGTTFTIGDGGNKTPNTLPTGNSGFQTVASGFSTEQPYVPGGTLVTGDKIAPPIAPVTVNIPNVPGIK